MNTFFCIKCDERLFFENTLCLACGSTLGYLPDTGILAALESAGGDLWRVSSPDFYGGRAYRQCQNYAVENICNWMIPDEDPEPFCLACRLNRTIPDLGEGNNRALWGKLEAAKRRLVYTLIRLGLPVVPRSRDERGGLAFDFLADTQSPEDQRVITGHAAGLITINVAEADDAAREKMRLKMGEVYRTLLGHFRHESGHFYWDVLVRDHPRIDAVRALFGDERADYAEALNRYYEAGPPADWESRFVTPYAAAHPWEDWAESWAHYLHIMDTMETAAANGFEIRGRSEHHLLADPFGHGFSAIREDWPPLRFGLNSLNRSMGMPDPYPFILAEPVGDKLAFIHQWIGEFVSHMKTKSAVI